MLYLSGPISGRADDNRPAFAAATASLTAAGHAVCNPLTLPAPAQPTWAQYLRADLAVLLTCDGVAVLDDWASSRGSRLEVLVALAVGIPVAPVAAWIATPRPLVPLGVLPGVPRWWGPVLGRFLPETRPV